MWCPAWPELGCDDYKTRDGGFAAGRIMRKNRYLWGIVTGLSYYVLLLLVSFLAQGKWDMTFIHAVTTFFMCLGGGAIGGMLS